MKHKFTLLLGLFFAHAAFTQTPAEYQLRLYKTAKVWGYMKYFHSRVNTCQLNWDSVLLATLPTVKACTNETDFNSILLYMLNSAGPMALPTVEPAPITPGYDKNLDLNWFHSSGFSAPVQAILDTVKSRFRPHSNCYVNDSKPGTKLTFDDSVSIASPAFPAESGRLLLAFRYWNIIRYFFPSNDIMDQPWDSTLMQFVLRFSNVENQLDYQLCLLEFVAKINDTHASGSGTATIFSGYYGYYYPNFKVEYIEGQTVVTNIYGASPLSVGDVIVKINGISCDSLRNKFKKYVPASNPAALQRDLNMHIISGQNNSTMALEVQTASGNSTFNVIRNIVVSTYYSSVDDISKKNPLVKVIRPQNFGYINMAQINGEADLNGIYDDSLQSKAAIIFDFRNYPSTSVPYSDFFNNIADQNRLFVQLTIPDIYYPGVLNSIHLNTFGNNAPSKTYPGKIIVLVNEETQSAAEYSTMALQSLPNVKTVGSQTAGADGNISKLTLPGNFFTYFSTLKVLYPDGYSAQRNGIRLDRTVTRTVIGVRNGADEILEAGISAASGIDGMEGDDVTVNIYPNPAGKKANIDLPVGFNKASIKVMDMVGNTVMELDANSRVIEMRTDDLNNGIYFVAIFSGGKSLTKKILVQN